MRFQSCSPTLHTISIKNRSHKTITSQNNLLKPEFSLDSFPDYLGAKSLKQVISAILKSVHNKKPVIVAFGAHVIKVGCSPILIDLMDRGIIKGIAGNTACAIHDVELAMYGETSEDVEQNIQDGSFGMVQETFDFFNTAIDSCKCENIGFGYSVGELLKDAPYKHLSVFYKAYEMDLPATIHVGVGTDTIFASPYLDPAALGMAAIYDFRLICNVVENLNEGVWINIGSAVILPEVFLKAVSIARNQGVLLNNVTTVNMDMNHMYRPYQNVVLRPFPGQGYEIIGHHEIMLPLLRLGIIQNVDRN